MDPASSPPVGSAAWCVWGCVNNSGWYEHEGVSLGSGSTMNEGLLEGVRAGWGLQQGQPHLVGRVTPHLGQREQGRAGS